MAGTREWMYNRLDGKYLSKVFISKVDEFILFACAQEEYKRCKKLKCPCVKCRNIPYLDVDTVKLHLYQRGFRANYYRWVHHGEPFEEEGRVGISSSTVDILPNPMRDMVMDAYAPVTSLTLQEAMHQEEQEPIAEAKRFLDLLKAAEKPLYEGCQMSLLKAVARLTNLKCEFNLPHRAVDGIAAFMKEICPNNNEMAGNYYEIKKLLAGLELPHRKIDVCPNGCMLFWKDAEILNVCSICDERRYLRMSKEGKHIPRKQLIYFPIGPRLQRLYATKNIAENMRWHHEHKRPPGVMAHPSDSEAWKHLDVSYPEFAREPRNVRLGLCTDGFSPFGHYGQTYSCWPVIVTPYNLPPWMCKKRQFKFIALLIPGPKNPKGNLDIYMQPLIEELVQLWNDGIMTYDVSLRQNFSMKVVLLWTVSDFPAYGMLSGWMTAGKLACPYCMEHTKSFRLAHGNKQSWFDCHRQFLPMDHKFRRNKTAFSKNREELSEPPPYLTGEQLWSRVSSLPTAVEHNGKPRGYGQSHNWTRCSIFWQLPYWSKLLIRHNLDVMHIEKNVFEQILNTVMNVKDKTKDDLRARKDMSTHCKRRRLDVQVIDDGEGSVREIMPRAPYVLTKDQRKKVCEWIHSLKFCDGYASNLGRCVDMRNGVLHNMKSHDCHIFMQRLVPLAFRDILPANVWKVLTELSQFFRDLCASKLHVDDVLRLEKNIAEILCKMERIFPPAFFNVMEHLPVHLPRELRLGGPVQYRWMYDYERFLHHLKGKVGNKARVEPSICYAYLMEEITNFIAHYFDDSVDIKARDLPRNVIRIEQDEADANLPQIFSRNVGYAPNEGSVRFMDHRDHRVAHAYVLSNCGLLRDYEQMFEAEMTRQNPRLRTEDVWIKFDDRFQEWFKKYVLHSNVDDDVIKALAFGPKRHVRRWDHYYVNDFNFHTYEYGKNKATMNYGVCVKATDGMEYYGILQNVIELCYVGDNRAYKTILFKCDWFDSINGVSVHETYKLVDVNHTKRHPKYDPYVLPSQVTQVCFTPYPMEGTGRKDWWAVLKMKPRATIDALEEETPFQVDENDSPPNLEDIDVDDEGKSVADMHNYLERANDEDSNDVHITDDEEQEGSLDDDIDNMNDANDDYFNESLFM